ncbi:mariner Mos1 transposase [Trichonephila clavipes]|nr:mariner Mos1 transposase [Trichonephila clavipes]
MSCVVYYELLKQTETITGVRYRTQLMRLSRALKDKRPQYNERHDKVILQHGNAQPHVAKEVKTYLETLKWGVLPHPLYSPDLAPSDYYLFRSIAHGLADQHFRSYEVKNWIDSWIASKDNQFFQRGIRTLPERWVSEEEITEFVQLIPGFQECDEEDVENWMVRDAEDCGFQMLNDDEIVTSVQEESDAVDD